MTMGFDSSVLHMAGCVCRLGPDCPRPGHCDASVISQLEQSAERADRRLAGQLTAEHAIRVHEGRCATIGCHTDASEWITWLDRETGEPIAEHVCMPCADAYERRPALRVTRGCAWCQEIDTDPSDPERELCRPHLAEYEGLSELELDRAEREQTAELADMEN